MLFLEVLLIIFFSPRKSNPERAPGEKVLFELYYSNNFHFTSWTILIHLIVWDETWKDSVLY